MFLSILFAAMASLLAWRCVRLQRDAARLRLLAEHSGEMSWIIDCATLQLLYLSPALERRFGFDGAQQMAARLLHDLPARLARLAGGDASRRRLVRQFEHAHLDGSLVALEVSSTLVSDARGRPTALLGVLLDIGARRAREEEYRRFASMLSHEFRSPLATIDGAIQRLEMTDGDADAATRQRYRKIPAAIERLLALLDEHLTPQRMASLGRARQADRIAPRELLESAAAQAASNGHRITLHLSGLPAMLRCDPDGMRLCLQVLLENAVQYTPAGTHIALSGRALAQGGIEIVVSDDGPGVVEEDLPRLFDKGFRGSNVGATRGSGLGLYMARAVLEVHGATLSAQNRPEGGAIFRIWLPGTGKILAPVAGSSDNSITQAKSEPV